MAQRILGIDLGSHSIKVAMLEPKGRAGEFEVTAYEERVVPPGDVDVEDGKGHSLEERQAEVLSGMHQEGLLNADLVITGLPGDTAAMRTLRFPFSDPRKIEAALPFELESEIPFDLEDVVYSWVPVPSLSRGQGPSETEVLVAFARREAVEDHLALLARCGVDPRYVEFDALVFDDLFDGLFRARMTAELDDHAMPTSTPGGTVIEGGPDGPQKGIAVVDIGHRRTSVCVLAKDRVISAHTILHGGGDATRALARELGLPLEEAERGKRKEAFIEVTGGVAQFPEQIQISDILKQAYAPIARRLRQIFQATLSSSRVRVTQVVLVGGGSRIVNLDRHLSESLNVKVECPREIGQRLASVVGPMSVDNAYRHDGSPEAALAVGYALSGLFGDKTRARIDFRSGEYAWKGDLDFVKERAISLGVWLAVICVFLFTGAIARAMVLGADEDALRKQQQEACESITGQKIDSISRCLGMIQERISGQTGDAVPEWSAVDTYLEVSRRMPPAGTLTRKVSEIDINPDRVRLKATTQAFDDVDKIVSGLQAGRCFESVEKGKARNVKDGVEFDALIRIDCSKAFTEVEAEASASPGVQADAQAYQPPEVKARIEQRMESIRQRRGGAPGASRKPRSDEDETTTEDVEAAGQEQIENAKESARSRAKARAERRKQALDKEVTKARRLEARERAMEEVGGGNPLRGPGLRDLTRAPVDLQGRRLMQSRRGKVEAAEVETSSEGEE